MSVEGVGERKRRNQSAALHDGKFLITTGGLTPGVEISGSGFGWGVLRSRSREEEAGNGNHERVSWIKYKNDM
jgi:hypothetical protein